MTTRRTFLQGAAALLLTDRACASSPQPAPEPSRADLVLRGGAVFDGSGAPAVEADVAITAGADPRAASVVRQGITTIVAGQDGGSRAPFRTFS